MKEAIVLSLFFVLTKSIISYPSCVQVEKKPSGVFHSLLHIFPPFSVEQKIDVHVLFDKSTIINRMKIGSSHHFHESLFILKYFYWFVKDIFVTNVSVLLGSGHADDTVQ